jgi:glycosyltransferase involved in cell wall biosynthesis
LKKPEYRKITVLFLIDYLDSMGGAERNLLQLVTALKKGDHVPIVACLQGGSVSRMIENLGIQVEDLLVKKIYGVDGVKALLSLKRIISRQGADLIVTYHEGSDFLGIVLSFLTRTPIISNRRDLGFNLKPRHIFIYRIINRFFSRIITVSTATKTEVVKRQNCLESKITVIHNGVDVSDYVSQSLGKKHFGLEESRLLICCLANIRSIKGQEFLLESARLLKEKGFSNFQIILIGKFEKSGAYYLQLREMVDEFELGEFVDFKGYLSPREIKKRLAVSDIGVLPSLSEGFSNALLEYMAAGLPVVATEVGGNPEAILNGETGFLVPPGNPQALAGALQLLLNDNELRVEMGRSGKRRVMERFSHDLMISNYLAAFQSVIN